MHKWMRIQVNLIMDSFKKMIKMQTLMLENKSILIQVKIYMVILCRIPLSKIHHQINLYLKHL